MGSKLSEAVSETGALGCFGCGGGRRGRNLKSGGGRIGRDDPALMSERPGRYTCCMSETHYAEPIPCDTVFLMGAGAVANSWVPVIQALREFSPQQEVRTGDQANFVLANWVYHLRSGAVRLKMDDATDEDRQIVHRLGLRDRRLRQEIAAHIRVAAEQDFYRLRRAAVPLLHDPRWGVHRFFVTTNWDHALETELGFRSESVVHIHGDVESPNTLYLPTETADEPYSKAEENARIAALTRSAVQVIQGAKQVCIYGLSLSPLDAELGIVLTVGLESLPGRKPVPVYVVNLKEEVKETSWRIRAVTNGAVDADIYSCPIEREPEPDVPEGWDQRHD